MSEGGSQTISTGFSPRAHQLEVFHKLKRFNVLVTHRRFGKTHLLANLLIDRALRCQLPMPRMYYVAPTFAMAKRIVWDVFKRYGSQIPGVEFNENDLRVDIPANKARIQLLSAENPRANVGVYSDYVVFDEYGDQVPSVFTEVFRPTMSDRRGHAAFAGTLRGTNHFYELWQYANSGVDVEWQAFDFKASYTKIIPEDELESLRRTMPEEEYLQEYENDPHAAGAVGSYFARGLAQAVRDGRVSKVPHDPALPVDCYWDLGISDAMTTWFVQSTRGKHHVIDYMEEVEMGLPEYVRKMAEKKYVFGAQVLPHDAAVRDLSTGKTRVQTLASLGLRNIRIVPRVGRKMESIDAARRILSLCYFDLDKCAKGIKALQQYKKKWNEQMQIYGENPQHDWSSHGADGFQTFAMGCREDSRYTENEFLKANKGRDGSLSAETEYPLYGNE